MTAKTCGGQSMTGRLRRVLVCEPESAGWAEGDSWEGLGYFHAPDLELAASQHAELVSVLERAGAEVSRLPSSAASNLLTLDAVYAHDASFPTDHGMILMNPGKANRRGEADVQGRWFEDNGIPVLGRIEPPGVMEAGDMVWLDRETVLVGEGYRTNARGIAQLEKLLAPFDVRVIAAPLPYGPGPSACLHLMSLVSLVDERVALVDLPWLSVSTVTLFERNGFELVPMDAGERHSLGCNVLALGDKRLLAIAENEKTNARLEKEGFEVWTYRGSEISANGSGGPTCLTRPILRE